MQTTLIPPPLRAFSTLLFASLILALGMTHSSAALANANSGKKFGEWTVFCETPEMLGHEVCHLVQERANLADNSRLAELVVTRGDSQDQLAVLITLPLGIWLPDGASIEIDKTSLGRRAIATCEPGGCVVGFGLKPDEHEALTGGLNLRAIFTYEGQAVAVDFPLKGLNLGLGALN